MYDKARNWKRDHEMGEEILRKGGNRGLAIGKRGDRGTCWMIKGSNCRKKGHGRGQQAKEMDKNEVY